VPRFGPVSRRQLIEYLRRYGFSGPYAGTRHQFMVRGDLEIRIPNPHGGDIGRDLLAEILRQAGITRDEWEAL
jgi:hypothetical protein